MIINANTNFSGPSLHEVSELFAAYTSEEWEVWQVWTVYLGTLVQMHISYKKW
jgi:hypothetical protein